MPTKARRHFVMRAHRPSLSCQRGAVAVEFGLVLPLILAIIFLITDFGRFFNALNDSNQVAATGARMAAVDQYPGESVLREQLDLAESRDGSEQLPGGIDICVKMDSGESVGDPVTVRTEGTFHLVPLLDAIEIPLVSEATMRLERAPSFSSDC